MTEKMKSFVKGILLGLVGKPLPTPEREPVAFLYNGVRLPKLPEWDRVQLHKAVICKSGSGAYPSLYSLNVMAIPFCEDDGAYADVVKPLYENGSKEYTIGVSHYNDGASAWDDMKFYTISEKSVESIGTTPIWANHNIYNEDTGALYIAASDPVPVYE